MSWQLIEARRAEPPSCPALELTLVPQIRDLGGCSVRRALPAAERRMVGPFIFWDQMSPSRFAPGAGLDVGPHPHVGLATVTYLFAGEILPRDSLGAQQRIEPGAVTWMIAGRGIVHSEGCPPRRARAGRCSPGSRPGSLFPGRTRRRSRRLGTTRALYVADGEVTIAGDLLPAGRMLVFRSGDEMIAEASAAPARLLALGGAPMDGPRSVWWNLVSSSRERIERAVAAWEAGEFAPVPGETERIPLPAR